MSIKEMLTTYKESKKTLYALLGLHINEKLEDFTSFWWSHVTESEDGEFVVYDVNARCFASNALDFVQKVDSYEEGYTLFFDEGASSYVLFDNSKRNGSKEFVSNFV